MSHLSSRLRRGAAIGGALALALAAAPAADAAVHTLTTSCSFPGTSSTPVKVVYDLNTPVKVEEASKSFSITSVEFTAPVFDSGTTATGRGTFSAAFSRGDISIPAAETFDYPLTATSDGPAWFPEEAGEWKFVVKGLTLNLRIVDGSGNPVRWGGGVEEDSDGDPDTSDIRCTPPVGGTAPSVLVTDGTNQPPTTPGPITIGPRDHTSTTINWGASVDDQGIAAYDVFLNGAKVGSVPGSQTSYRFTGLAESTTYQVGVRAIDTDGVASQASTATFTTIHVDRFGTPTAVQAITTASSAALTWSVQGGFEPPAYGVIVDGKLVKTVTTKSAIVPLAPGFTYSIQIASLAGETEVGRSAPVLVKIDGPTNQSGDFITKGSATIKTLVAGKVSLTGGLRVSSDVHGDVSGDFALNPASARLSVLGFLPVTAKLAFAPSGELTGSYDDGTLTTNTKVRIKVIEAKLFGAIPLVAGNNCQTRQLTDLTLTSPGFSFATGGTLTGKFAISDLNGCGVLNGLVSPVTAGTNNTITLQATNTPPPVDNR